MLPEEGDALPVTPTTHVYTHAVRAWVQYLQRCFCHFRPVSVDVSRDGSYFSEEDEV